MDGRMDVHEVVEDFVVIDKISEKEGFEQNSLFKHNLKSWLLEK